LDRPFDRYVGLLAKVLAAIFAFKRSARKWALWLPGEALKEELYDYYYDSAHFDRQSKMTGYSRRKSTLEVGNEFGRRLPLK